MAQPIDEDQKAIIQDFVTEGQEMLDQVEPLMVALETVADPMELEEIINMIFRLFHSFKGGAGFLHFEAIQQLTHGAENILTKFRQDPRLLESTHVELLTASCDLLRQMIKQVAVEFNDAGFGDDAERMVLRLAQSIGTPPDTGPKMATPLSAAVAAPAPVPQALAFKEDPDLLRSFISDTEEQLSRAEDALLVLEKLPDIDAEEYLQTLFRCFHVVKGNAGLLELALMADLCHQAETVLVEIKEGRLHLHESVSQTLLAVLDILRQAAVRLAAHQDLEEPVFTQAQARLANLLTMREETAASSAPLGEILEKMGVDAQAIESALKHQQAPLGEILVDMGAADSGLVAQALSQQRKNRKTADSPALSHSSTQQDIRIGLEKLDALINLVGEMVISEAMVTQHPDLKDLPLTDFRQAARYHNKNIRELQELAMSMRMVPISVTFRKMIRLVHDTAKKAGKQARLEIRGEETEIDKTIIEQIADPLVHMLRNAVDHGLESPQERRAAKKAEEGTIRLEARHSGNEILIIIADDGKGLEREKILAKAREKGLIAPETALVDEEIWPLIFEPGFSTAEVVTELSGRGVGMDVVKRNLEKLHGRITITSQQGQGCSFVLRIPLTLAIIEGMILQTGASRYVLPLIAVRESFQLEKPEDITVTMDGQEMVRIREEILPIVHLHELHELTPAKKTITQGTLIVIQAADRCLCLFADKIVGKRQIVVKHLPSYLGKVAQKKHAHISGCTILGDGHICLILDAVNLLNEVRSLAAQP